MMILLDQFLGRFCGHGIESFHQIFLCVEPVRAIAEESRCFSLCIR